MSGNHGYKVTAVYLGLVVSLWAQPQTVAPKFDVVSIRLVPPNAPPLIREADYSSILPGGRFIDARIPLSVMIGVAYNMKTGSQVIGLPAWAENTSYEIAAKAGEEYSAATPRENIEQVRLMVRAMLADRFHLEIHSETKNGEGFLLDVAKGGLKINEVAAPIPPEKEGIVFGYGRKNGGGQILGKKATMAGLARCLTVCLGRPVVDHTGLKGYYDFDLTWVGEGENGKAEFGSFDFVAGAILALRREVGIGATKTTVPVEQWKVTHVEPPTEN